VTVTTWSAVCSTDGESPHPAARSMKAKTTVYCGS
jgi:hypothetical protein